MIDFLTIHSGVIVSVLFFTMFVGIAIWSYLPRNKRRLQNYGNIPFEGDDHGR